MRAAKYTAQTDHLRRMREKTRQSNNTRKAWGILDVAHMTGGWLWAVAFLLQFAWHLGGILTSLQLRDDGMYDPDDHSLLTKSLAKLYWMAERTPVDALLAWSSYLSLAVIWWNPYFVAFYRGHTRHLCGFKQWYYFQILICSVRLLLQRPSLGIHRGTVSQSITREAILSAHGGVMALSLLVR